MQYAIQWTRAANAVFQREQGYVVDSQGITRRFDSREAAWEHVKQIPGHNPHVTYSIVEVQS